MAPIRSARAVSTRSTTLWTDEFRGNGFKYDDHGTPTAGTIKSYTLSDFLGKVVTILQGDIDGDGIADLGIEFGNLATALQSSDLEL